MERRGKTARCWRDRERGWLREEVASVVKTAVEENGPFRIRIGLKR